MTRGGRALSVSAGQSIKEVTPGDGPWVYGIMSGGLTLSQLTAYLEQNGPVSPAVVAEAEITSRGRNIRRLGMIVPTGDGTTATSQTYLQNHSLSGLRFAENSEVQGGWDWWLYNVGQDMTTAAVWTQTSAVFVEFNPSG